MRVRVDASPFLSKKTYSGVGYYSKLLTQALKNDNKVDAVTGPSSNETVNKIYRKLTSYDMAPYFDLFMSRVDLTIFPNFNAWPTIKSKKTAVVIHDLTYIYYPELVEKKNLAHLRRVVPRSIKRSDFVITISESVKTELVKEFSLDPHKCIVTPIPPDDMYYRQNDNEIHTKYNLPTEKFILFIGNMEPRKNLSLLIRSYRDLDQKIKDEYSLVLGGGKGWKSEECEQLLDEAKQNDENVTHVGYIDQDDISAFYQKSSLFVMPSLYEGFGMPILEAMACSTPVLASDIPVLHETAGSAALFFDPHDQASLCQMITVALQDKIMIDSLLQKSKKRLGELSWKNNVSEIIKKSTNS